MKLNQLVLAVIISFCWFKNAVEGANILAVLSLPFVSHFKTFKPLLEEMVKRGDNLTLIAHFPLDAEIQSNYSMINIGKYVKIADAAIMRRILRLSVLEMLIYFRRQNWEFSAKISSSSEMQAIINSKAEYDVVLAELFMTDIFVTLGHKLKAPIVALISQSMLPSHNWVKGNAIPSSYVPHLFLPYTEKMSLISRIINSGFNLISTLHYEFVNLPMHQTLLEKYFHYNESNKPHLKDILKNVSIFLVNAHHSFEYPKPDQPNVINVGGLHFTNTVTLPKNINKFMNEAEHGVIYLSFGTIIEPNFCPELGETLLGILKMLPQRVIMKWSHKLLSHIPDNILVAEWLPQSSILNHPNCRLFITHGGLLSLMESLNASVPLIGVPYFGDQYHNMAMVEYFGIGKTIAWKNIVSGNGDEFTSKIDEVLNNPKYKENIQKRSKLFRDRLSSPLNTAMYWIDYVIEHKDISHLKSAASQLSWFELYSVDVITIAAVFICLIAYFLTYVACKIKILLICFIMKIRKTISSIATTKSEIKKNSKND